MMITAQVTLTNSRVDHHERGWIPRCPRPSLASSSGWTPVLLATWGFRSVEATTRRNTVSGPRFVVPIVRRARLVYFHGAGEGISSGPFPMRLGRCPCGSPGMRARLRTRACRDRNALQGPSRRSTVGRSVGRRDSWLDGVLDRPALRGGLGETPYSRRAV